MKTTEPNQALANDPICHALCSEQHRPRQLGSRLVFNVGQRKMNPSYPNAKSACSPSERTKIKRVVAERELCGLANDTKWDEFVDAMRAREEWRPSYRFKCVDGPISGWDVEWFYHLPFPLISVEWLDLVFFQERKKHLLVGPEITDHSGWIEEILKAVGLDYRKGTSIIRIFGYSPRSTELFDQE